MRNSRSETEPVPTKSSQSPLRIRSVQVEGVEELGNEEVTSNEVPMTIQARHSQAKVSQCSSSVIWRMKHSQILQWKQSHLAELVLGQQNRLWIQRGRASARSLWISHGGRRARGGKSRGRRRISGEICPNDKPDLL